VLKLVENEASWVHPLLRFAPPAVAAALIEEAVA